MRRWSEACECVWRVTVFTNKALVVHVVLIVINFTLFSHLGFASSLVTLGNRGASFHAVAPSLPLVRKMEGAPLAL